jgi:uncharacterized repeat protein (TIGR02543 family)
MCSIHSLVKKILIVAMFVFLSVNLTFGATKVVGDIADRFIIQNYLSPAEPIDLYNYAGKILVIDFWAYWCGPCKTSMPLLESEIRQYYLNQGGNAAGIPVEVISISTDNGDMTAVQSFVDIYKPHVVGLYNGQVSQFMMGYIPHYAVINCSSNSTSHKQWEVVYNMYGYKQDAIRSAIDSVTVPEKPTVVITTPTEAQRIVETNATYTIIGTAADDMAVAIVKVQLNSGDWLDASGTNDWSLPVTLEEGLNTICAFSMDVKGNASLTSQVTCTYAVAGNLTIQTNGLGTVTRTPEGTPEVGTTYTLTAAPASGYGFSSWTGDSVSNPTNKTVTFTMTANMTITANFMDILKPTVTVVAPLAKTTNGLLMVRGTSTDNKAVASVWVQVNSNGWTKASGTNSWASTVNLDAGLNAIRVYSMDTTGNCSLTSTVASTYVVIANLTIQTNGIGTVSRTPTGAPEVNKTYTLTAAAGTGSIFSNWTGAVNNPTNKVTTFVMTSTMTISVNFADVAKPTVVIKTPTALQKVFGTNGSFTVTGTALDNLALSNVMVKVNSGSFVPANATTNGLKSWNLPVVLSLGTNTITAYSVDTTGNSSGIVTAKCVYTETGALNISTNGPGKVTVTPTGPLLLNKTYTLTAAAGAGAVFSNWTGGVVIGSPTSKVVKVTLNDTNKIVAVTANFTDTAKPTVVITYPANNAKILTNGLVVIRGTASDNGALSEVKYQLRTGDWTNAVSTNVFKVWAAPYVPAAGLNTSKVYSVDAQGNISATSTVVFTYIPGAVLTVQTNGNGTITPSLNGKVLQIGSTNIMTAAPKAPSVFVNWTAGIGGSQVTTGKVVKFVMTTNLVLTANFRSLPAGDAVADVLAAGIVVDGSSKDWTGIPRSSFSYASTTQEIAVALDGNNIALLLNGCPFNTPDTVLVYFKLRLIYGEGDNRHTVDLWTSGSVLYGMVDGQVITGLEAILLNGALEVKIPVEQAPSQVVIEEVGCAIDDGTGTMKELFRLILPPASTL